MTGTPTAERIVEATLELIAEQGGSRGVNLREVARRVGCAHTNVYNYFDSFEGLLWEAFRRVLDDYGSALFGEPDGGTAGDLEGLVSRLAEYPQRHPGWYRFIGSDPVGGIPSDILETVTEMKVRLYEAFAACAPGVDRSLADESADIVYAYLDGEAFNLINGRVVPGEDVGGRMVDNGVRLFEVLTKGD